MCNNWLFRKKKKKKKGLNFEKSALKGNESHANSFHVNNPMADHTLLMTSLSVELETENPYGLVPASPPYHWLYKPCFIPLYTK